MNARQPVAPLARHRPLLVPRGIHWGLQLYLVYESLPLPTLFQDCALVTGIDVKKDITCDKLFYEIVLRCAYDRL
jgi:hypothetical protein